MSPKRFISRPQFQTLESRRCMAAGVMPRPIEAPGDTTETAAQVSDSGEAKNDLTSSIPVSLTISVQPVNDAPRPGTTIDGVTIDGNTANQNGGGIIPTKTDFTGGVRVGVGDIGGDAESELTDDGGFIEPFDAYFAQLGRDEGSNEGQSLEAAGLEVVVAAATTETATPHG